MTPGSPNSALRTVLVLVLTVAVGAACSSGTGGATGAKPTTTIGATGPTTAGSTAAGAGSTIPISHCQSNTTATGGGGGADVLVPGDIPDSAHFVTYHAPDGYHVDHPEGWAQQASGSSVTFTDKFNAIRVETAAAAAAPSVASAQADDVTALKASAACFEPGKVSQVTRTSGPAILITYRADSPPDPVTGKVVLEDVERYEFWQSGKQATITLSSPKGSDNVDPWKKVTDSFAWGP